MYPEKVQHAIDNINRADAKRKATSLKNDATRDKLEQKMQAMMHKRNRIGTADTEDQVKYMARRTKLINKLIAEAKRANLNPGLIVATAFTTAPK